MPRFIIRLGNFCFILRVAPFVILAAIFMLYPMIKGVQNSFFDFRFGGTKFVGLKNYVKVFTDKTYLLSIRNAERTGADAVSAISPFYYKFSEQEIIGYYNDIMASTNLPMFIYNFPNFSGFSLTENVLDRLSENKNMIGVKFTSSY